MRFIRYWFTMALLCLTAIPLHAAAPAAVGSSPLVSAPVPGPAVRAASLTHQVPAQAPRSRSLEMVVLAAAIGATKKTATRRAAGKVRDVPMYLDSEAHVMRENDEGKKITTIIKGGVLVDDTDLEDEEIDELTARRVIRPATPAELERLSRVDAETQRAELVSTQQAELSQLRANTEAQRAGLVAKGSKAEDLVSFDEKAAEDVAKLQEKHAAALAKLDQQ